MITPEMVYWVGQCDNIRAACAVFTVVGVVFGLLGTVFMCMAASVREMAWAWGFGIASSVFGLLLAAGLAGLTFCPSTKTVAAMYVIPAVANSEKVQDVGDRIYRLAVEWMEELRPGGRRDGK